MVLLVGGSYCQLSSNSAAEGAWVDLKPHLRRHRAAEGPVLDLRAKGNVFQKGQKVDPLETPWRVSFWFLFDHFIVANLLKRLFRVEADLTSNSCGWNLKLGRPIFARLLFLMF